MFSFPSIPQPSEPEPQDTPIALRADEDEKVYRWRVDQLERCGYMKEYAELLAGNPDVDIHTARQMAKAGCDLEIALHILL